MHKKDLLKIALLPTEKILPLLVAQANGYFQMSVELHLLNGPHQRDEAAAHQLFDGYLMNLVTVVLNHITGLDMRTTQLLLRPAEGRPMFYGLSRPGLNTPPTPQTPRLRLGISRRTIVEYHAYHWLNSFGLTMDQLEIIDLPNIENRFQQLLKGNLDYAILPDPLASLALNKGAKELADQLPVPLPPPTLTFHQSVLKEKGESIEKFFAALRQATQSLNQEPQRYLPLLATYNLLPPTELHTYHFTPFPVNQYPIEADFEPIIGWLQATTSTFPLSAQQLHQALVRKVGPSPTANPNV